MTELQILHEIDKHKTSHLLHLVLSLITAGIWVPVWILVTLSNGVERRRLARKLRRFKA